MPTTYLAEGGTILRNEFGFSGVSSNPGTSMIL